MTEKKLSETEIVNKEEKLDYFGEPIERNIGSDTENSAVSSSSSINENLDPDVLALPKIIRDVVPLDDDPTIPVLTFRYVLLSIIFVAPGAFISTLNSFRTTSAAYSIFFVQICSHWLGKWLAKILPKKTITPFGIEKLSFSLNPGPWSIKETTLVTITASSGATGSLATNAFALGELYFNTTVHPAAAIFFMYFIVLAGYSYSILLRTFLVFDSLFVWPQSLMQTALLQSFKNSDNDSRLGRKQVKIFFSTLIGITIWQFFPEYIFPMTSSLAFLCWVASSNPTANFIGSGIGGMGFLNLSLDWANITSTIFLSPFWVQAVKFIAFVFGAWILIPAAKWSNLSNYKYALMSNSLYTDDGELYPTSLLINSDFTFNSTAYEEYGPVHMGAQRAWNMFFDYAAYISGITWVVLFGYKGLYESLKKVIKNVKYQRENKDSNIHHLYNDRINKLQAAYKEVPFWWYVILFVTSFITLIIISATNAIALPWWTVIIAFLIGIVIVVPLSWLYAVSNFQLPIGTFNELLFSYMIKSQEERNPMLANLYGALAGDLWYRAQYQLQDMSIGSRMQLPPRLVFMSQMFGILISCPINYGCMRWILNTKRGYLEGKEADPTGQWTGQTIVNYHAQAIQYIVLGPEKLFANYPMLPYGFLAGFICPIILVILHKLFPKSKFKFHLWNTTVFFSTLSTFYGNLSTGYLSQFIGGFVVMFMIYRYKHHLWKTYNYIIAASFDTGYNLAVLLIFLFFTVFPGKAISFPHWWGNNAESVERCFALDS
ncbi:OPT superfamily oligopeptide transporter [Hyphopichia burtonii NRRL Y-1933]|uniref:OPT superfamily oligopeptide transporter n=1 Tax=Hyphopichia burtonii NRRL Y-1933 TaxID=984485 RepID=A0A1E4RTU4_9ASCO|nr:OPT superfamily oligopeptide transporter [Hyphopichia burtonii NRRL Y-1933]ODV70485.1 OPT superfamily oligopeptide transporter [Hyphopichia burtonii NRRL Y-1933]